MAGILERMIEAKRRENNKNVLKFSEQDKSIQSMLRMALSHAKANEEVYAGRTAKGHVYATSDQIDIENQIIKNLYTMSKKELLIVAIFCATSQNKKAEKVLIKKIQRLLGAITEADFKFIMNCINNNVDKELVARVNQYLSENIVAYKGHYIKYCTYYYGY